MARQQVEYQGSSVGLRTSFAPDVTAVTARNDPRGSGGFALAEALGVASPMIDKMAEADYLKVEKEQLAKVDAYRTAFMKDRADGAVNQAQLKQVMPELVPTVRAKIMESIGAEQGKKAIQSAIEELNGNDELRLDSTKRQAFLGQKREEILKQLGAGDDFALSGMVRSIDSELNQWENQWQRETAKYHEQVQSKAFSEEVVSTLRNGGNLEELDAKWKSSSSLNNLERNKLVIDSVTKEAYASADPSILDKIPTRFLNAESKAELQQTRLQIEQVRITKLRNAAFERDEQRAAATRSAKIEMIRAQVNGQPISPENYLNNPDAYAYALQMQNAGKLPGYQSAANAQKIRIGIMDSSSVADMDPNQIIDSIVANPGINPAEKQKLIDEVPALVEGRQILSDPMVKNAMSAQLGARLDVLEKSLPAVLGSTVEGRSLRAEAQRAYEFDLRSKFRSYYEQEGRWPTGKAKQEIIDKATEDAGKRIEATVSAIMKPGSQAAQPAAQQTPSGTPGSSASNPVTVTNDADFNKLPKGAFYIGPDKTLRQKQ